MIASTMHQLKISKMRKRLSSDQWLMRLNVIGILGLFLVLTFTLRSAIMPARYGIVDAEIPLMMQPLSKKVSQEVPPSAVLSKETPMVVLTTQAFYFGDLRAFSTDLAEVRNKFAVKHVDGAPDLDSLIHQMTQWLGRKKMSHEEAIILLPSGAIPAPIVIQVIAGLKESPLFSKVVLAGGLK